MDLQTGVDLAPVDAVFLRPEACDRCGNEDLVIVKAYPDLWECKDDDGGTDAFQDHDADDSGHFAMACRKCDCRIVPGTHWIEP